MTEIQAPPAVVRREFAVAERTQFQMVLRRFLSHKLAVISLVFFLLLMVFVFVGPLLWKYNHFTSTPDNSQPPSLEHPFGTTSDGKDLLALVMRGAQQSVKISLLIALLSTTFGTIWGATAGYFRGVVDAILMRISDLFIILPLVAVAAVLTTAGEGAWWMVALVIAGLVWANVSRVVRGVVLSLREQEYIEAARALGATDARIIFRHLVPNAMGPVIVTATVLIAIGILVETALSFLGFGVQPPDTSLGILVSEARTAVQTRPWLFYFPGLFIILVALSVNFIGDGLRDALDPKQTRVRQ